MGAGVSAIQYSEELLLKVSEFGQKVTLTSSSLPEKDACLASNFNAEGTETTVPQKYIWLQSMCSPFVMYTEMQGKTLPELWDSIAGPGFTEHTAEQIVKISQELIVNTLAPEIKLLLETNVDEEENKEAWKKAVGEVVHRNIKLAKEKTGNDSMQALAGVADAVLDVPAEVWIKAVYTPVCEKPVETEAATEESGTAMETDAAGEDAENDEQATAKRQKTDDAAEESAMSCFCLEKSNGHGNLPLKDEAKHTAFNLEEEEQVVPQKYCWVDCLCAPFAMYTNMDGKTFPQLWDATFGPGFTEFTPEEMKTKAKELMEATLAPEIKALLDAHVYEEDNGKAWDIAFSTVLYRNATQAKEIQGEIPIQFALVGTPDEVLNVEPYLLWKSAVWALPLFNAETGKFNGDSYTNEDLETITGAPVSEDNIYKTAVEEEEEEEAAEEGDEEEAEE